VSWAGNQAAEEDLAAGKKSTEVCTIFFTSEGIIHVEERKNALTSEEVTFSYSVF
jgi:hypothetical protein